MLLVLHATIELGNKKFGLAKLLLIKVTWMKLKKRRNITISAHHTFLALSVKFPSTSKSINKDKNHKNESSC